VLGAHKGQDGHSDEPGAPLPDKCPDLDAYLRYKRQQGHGAAAAPFVFHG
jgi:hypothetical protein